MSDKSRKYTTRMRPEYVICSAATRDRGEGTPHAPSVDRQDPRSDGEAGQGPQAPYRGGTGGGRGQDPGPMEGGQVLHLAGGRREAGMGAGSAAGAARAIAGRLPRGTHGYGRAGLRQKRGRGLLSPTRRGGTRLPATQDRVH